MAGKWLELLKEIAPQVTRVAVIHNPENQTWRANDPMPSNRRLSRQKTLWRQRSSNKPIRHFLVHGAWADSSSWNGVVDLLLKDGYTVRALPNTLADSPQTLPSSQRIPRYLGLKTKAD